MSARESIIPVFVPHLGCPNDCVFCNQRRISGSLAPASPEDVRHAVESAGEGVSQLAFTADHSRPYPCRNRRLCSRLLSLTSRAAG